MSDSNSGDTSGSPYGPPPSENPYGQPADPYGQQQPPPQNPYGEQPPPQSPQEQPAQPPGYGQPAYGQPSSYGQQPTYGQPAYGYAGPATDKRPGTVTAASVITLIFSGLSLLLYAFILIALFVARDDIVAEITRQPDFEDAGISADSAFGVIVAFVTVFLVWCLIACVLAVLVLRRSNAARITLVVSASVTALFSLIGITSGVSAITLLAAVAVIVLLFAGGAGDWFKGRQAGQAVPGMTQY